MKSSRRNAGPISIAWRCAAIRVRAGWNASGANADHHHRLSVNPASAFYNKELQQREVGILFNSKEKTSVEGYCISEAWIKVTAGAAKDRFGNPTTIKRKGQVEPYFKD